MNIKAMQRFWMMLTQQQQILLISLIGMLVSIAMIHSSMGVSFSGLRRKISRSFDWLRVLFSKARIKDFVEIGELRLTDEARMRHMQILGSTGSGKTVLMEHLIYRDLARGYGAIIIDPKGDRELFSRIKDYCEKIGRAQDLHLLSSTYTSESVRWNPCRLGSVSELQSKFFCASKYEHSFYAKAAELALLQAFQNLAAKGGEAITVSDLAVEFSQLSKGGKDENLKGLHFDLKNLADGEWGPIIGTAPIAGSPREVSLLDITRKNEILFVDLPTEGKLVQSSRIGSLLLQEITLLSGIRKRMPSVRSDRPFAVFVDEFDAFATEPFVSFLNKGRSSDFMICLAHQTLSDLEKVSPTFAGQIMGNVNARFVFRLDVPEDAESLSKMFGTKISQKRTHQTEGAQLTGRGTLREVQEFRIHPDLIKELPVGRCIGSIKTDRYLEVVDIPMLSDQTIPFPKVPVHRLPMDFTQSSDQFQAIPTVSDPEEILMAMGQAVEGANGPDISLVSNKRRKKLCIQ